MTRQDTGLLVLVEEPDATAARWRDVSVPPPAASEIVAAVHQDLLANLQRAEGVALYLAPAGERDADYVQRLAGAGGVPILELPKVSALRRWDSGLSILHNRFTHRKVLCIDSRVPDVYPEDLSRVRRKLDLYPMIVGREDQDRCWLIGMNGYHEDVLGAAEVRPDDLLHPILQAAGRLGLEVSVMDTKYALASGASLEQVQALGRRPLHPRLGEVLAKHGLALPPDAP